MSIYRVEWDRAVVGNRPSKKEADPDRHCRNAGCGQWLYHRLLQISQWKNRFGWTGTDPGIRSSLWKRSKLPLLHFLERRIHGRSASGTGTRRSTAAYPCRYFLNNTRNALVSKKLAGAFLVEVIIKDLWFFKMIYTRHVGLDRDTNKGLLLKHIWANNVVGTPFKKLRQRWLRRTGNACQPVWWPDESHDREPAAYPHGSQICCLNVALISWLAIEVK